MSRCCVANLTHTCCKHQVSTKTHVLVASNSISLSCLERRIYIITLIIKSIASSHYFIKSITSSRCVEDTPGYTLVHTLVYDTYSPTRWVSRKLRPISKTIPRIAASRLLYCSSIQWPNSECVWFCNVTPDLYGEAVTQQTLR